MNLTRQIMNPRMIIYWIATSLIGLETLAGGFMDLTHGRTAVVVGEPVLDVVTTLGYPAYLLVILGLLKLPGAIVLFLPRLPRLKEWAYAGIVFEFTAAAASHAAVGHSLEEITPLWSLRVSL
jgi:uncharacterized membrane protein YphA (DoxX/SURF4 family)